MLNLGRLILLLSTTIQADLRADIIPLAMWIKAIPEFYQMLQQLITLITLAKLVSVTATQAEIILFKT